MQGSAPGSLCSGCGTVDRELQLVIETDVQLQLLIFYAFILAWGMLQTLLSWEARRWLWYLHCPGIWAAAPAVPGTWHWEGSDGSSGSGG